jgi:hypothetical protein
VVVMVMMPVMVMMVVPDADPDAMMVVMMMMTGPDGDLGYLGGFFGKPRIVGLQLR